MSTPRSRYQAAAVVILNTLMLVAALNAIAWALPGTSRGLFTR